MKQKRLFPTPKSDQTIISVDPGDKLSGITVIKQGQITISDNLDNQAVMKFIKNQTAGIPLDEITAIIEDIRPYAARLTMQIIETCKYIGELRYRLNEANIASEWVPRSLVKKWVFDTFPVVCDYRIRVKIDKKGLKSKDGKPRMPSFHFVDDRIVVAAMKECWSIETPKPGKKNKYKISAHGWQALAVGTYYLKT